MKHSDKICSSIRVSELLDILKNKGYIKWASYLSIQDIETEEERAKRLLEMMVLQGNRRAVA